MFVSTLAARQAVDFARLGRHGEGGTRGDTYRRLQFRMSRKGPLLSCFAIHPSSSSSVSHPACGSPILWTRLLSVHKPSQLLGPQHGRHRLYWAFIYTYEDLLMDAGCINRGSVLNPGFGGILRTRAPIAAFLPSVAPLFSTSLSLAGEIR